jgi:hypothetical protein
MVTTNNFFYNIVKLSDRRIELAMSSMQSAAKPSRWGDWKNVESSPSLVFDD